jgi:hypothetical protein
MENPKVWSTMLRQKWADIEIKDAFATMDEVRLPDREMVKAFFFFKLNTKPKSECERKMSDGTKRKRA